MYPSGRRGRTRNALGRLNGARVQIPASPLNEKPEIDGMTNPSVSGFLVNVNRRNQMLLFPREQNRQGAGGAATEAQYSETGEL